MTPFRISIAVTTVLVLGTELSTAQTMPTDSPCSDAALGVALDDWGRTLVVGEAMDNRILHWEDSHAHYGDLAVSRLMPDGSPDLGFGQAGNLLLDLGDFDELSEVVTTGRWTYVAGVTATTAGDRRGDGDLVVLRLGPAGEPDPLFGVEGKRVLNLGGDEVLGGLAVDPDGGVWLSGSTIVGGASDGFVLRLTAEGVLDESVGDAGVFRLDTGSDSDRLLSLQVLADAVYVGGVTTLEDEAAALAVGLDLHGQPLSNFGSNGIAVSVVGEALGNAAASFHGTGGSIAVTLTHVESDGSVHAITSSFDRQGQVADVSAEVHLPTGTSLTATELWSADSLYLSGAIYNAEDTLGDAFVARVAGEDIDPGFGGGLVREHFALEYASYYGLVLSFEGVTVAGWDFSEGAETLGASDALVARYTHDGALDPSFGTAGVALIDFHGGAAVCAPAQFLP